MYATSTRTCGAASQGSPRADATREHRWPAAAASGDRRGEAGGERHLLLALRGHRKRGLCVEPGLQRPRYVGSSSLQCSLDGAPRPRNFVWDVFHAFPTEVFPKLDAHSRDQPACVPRIGMASFQTQQPFQTQSEAFAATQSFFGAGTSVGAQLSFQDFGTQDNYLGLTQARSQLSSWVAQAMHLTPTPLAAARLAALTHIMHASPCASCTLRAGIQLRRSAAGAAGCAGETELFFVLSLVRQLCLLSGRA